MEERKTWKRPWVDCSADLGIAGKYYLHIPIDNYSQWAEVEVVKSPSLDLKCLYQSQMIVEHPISLQHSMEKLCQRDEFLKVQYAHQNTLKQIE